MTSEKKSVLVALVISAAIVIALYCALWFYGAVMSGAVIGAFVVVYFIVSAVVYHVAEELRFLIREKRTLADCEASRWCPPAAIPPTRIAAIVNRQRRGGLVLPGRSA